MTVKTLKILKITAAVFLSLVLVLALVYYNFLAPDDEAQSVGKSVYKVGDECPEFTLSLFKSQSENTEFSVFDCKGKVTVINYWQTTCGPCVKELPYFEQIHREYAGAINMVAVHSYLVTDNVQRFINDKGWDEWTMMLALDGSNGGGELTINADGTGYEAVEVDSFTKLGGKGAFPVTVIVNAEGVITFVRQGEIPESMLRDEIAKAMNN